MVSPASLTTPVVLVGFMAAGKTTVGRALADRLGRPFVDLDEVVVQQLGEEIPEIFARHGEAFFRRAERRALAGILGAGPQVIALGGGAFCEPATRRLVVDAGALSVFLDVEWPALRARLAQSAGGRPKLGSPAVTRRLFVARLSHYRQADIVLPVAGDEAVADTVTRLLGAIEALPCDT